MRVLHVSFEGGRKIASQSKNSLWGLFKWHSTNRCKRDELPFP